MAILSFAITRMWDGTEKTEGRNVHLTLKADKSDSAADGVKIEITAPFYDDPPPAGSTGSESGGPFFQLWDYEVVEAFFLSEPSEPGHETYLELEFGPHSHHLVLLLRGRKNIVEKCLPIQYETKIDLEKRSWHGTATIPIEYFPPGIKKFNAYAIHGSGDDRKYEALFPVPGEFPDFHRLEHFQPIDFTRLRPDNESADFSAIWRLVLQKE